MSRMKELLTLLLTVVLLLGCSSSRNPISVPVDGGPVNQLTGSVAQTPSGGAVLWGYYELYFDVGNKTIEATPIRATEFTANVVKFLNNDPLGLQVKFNGTTPGSGYVDLDMDITIKHPLSQHQFDGYDVRGVFVGNGAKPLTYNTDLLYAQEGFGQILLNADGYTRWYNPVEFLAPNMFGYVPGKLASTGYTGTATLNPYKYFGEGLGNSENVWDYLSSGDPQTGYFLAGTSNTRNYKIRFPIPHPGIKYGYAVVANWAGPDPQDHPSHAPEAIGVDVEDSSNLFYVDESTKGGNLKLDIKVFDWYAELDGGVMEDYGVKVESTVLTVPYELSTSEMTPTANGDHWYTYHVEIPADNIAGVEGNEMWVIVEDSVADYTNPVGVPNTADTDKIAACFRYPVTISTEEPMWIHVTSPNGGEQWKVGGAEEISWDANPDISSVAIILSLNSGDDYTEIVSLPTPNDGSFTWDPIPAFATGTADRIRVVDVADYNIYDSSDADFAVTSPSITVLTPNGGEVWKAGTAEEITWNADSDIAFVKIEFSYNNGVDYAFQITPETQNDGSFIWGSVLSGITSYGCRIKISDVDCPEIFDISDDFFSLIQPWITLTSPNGGEQLEGYMNWEITWDSSETGGAVTIEYSKDDFHSDFHIIAANTPNDGSYLWENIPLDLSDTVSMRIVCPNPPMSDYSDSYFSIIEPPPFIRVLTPNGGEEWGCGSTKEITWMSYGLTGNVDLFYSTDEFVSDNNVIAEDVPIDGSYEWTIPADISDTVMVKIVSVDSPSSWDVSNNDFSIIDAGWARTWGEETVDRFMGVVADADGNSYSLGETYNVYNDYSIAVLRKYDIAGELEWDITWGNHYYQEACEAEAIAIDNAGYLYVTGAFFGTVDFDPGAGTDLHSTSSDWDYDIYVSKFDLDGTWIWTRTWGGTGFEYATGVAVLQSNIYVTGDFDGIDADFDPDPVDSDLHSSNGITDAFLSELDASGDFIQAVTWGGTAYDLGYDVAVDAAGVVYVTGDFMGTVDFDPDPVGTALHSSNGESDAFLSWFDDEGTFLGAVTWGGTDDDHGSKVAVDGLGNVYTGGWFAGTDIDFDPGAGEDLHSSIGDSDTFLTKFDSSIQYQWMRAWVGLDEDDIEGMDADGTGNVFIVGSFEGQDVDFDPGAGSDLHSSNGEGDGYFKMLDTSGNYLMGRSWGGASWDTSLGLFVSDPGTIYVVGDFSSGWVDFAPVGAPCFEDSDVHITNGSGDAFLVKYMPDGCW